MKDDEDAEPRDQQVCPSGLQKAAPAHRSADSSSRLTQGDIFKSAYGQIRTKLLRMEERNVFCGTYFTTVLLDR